MHNISYIIYVIGMDFIQILNTHNNIYKLMCKNCDE